MEGCPSLLDTLGFLTIVPDKTIVETIIYNEQLPETARNYMNDYVAENPDILDMPRDLAMEKLISVFEQEVRNPADTTIYEKTVKQLGGGRRGEKEAGDIAQLYPLMYKRVFNYAMDLVDSGVPLEHGYFTGINALHEKAQEAARDHPTGSDEYFRIYTKVVNRST